MRLTRAIAAVATTVAVVALSACGSGSDTSTKASGQESTTSSALKTMVSGKLTIATGEPAYSPWVEDNKPESGKGFESAVAYAVAAKLGFSADQVVWKRTTFDAAIAPGPKDFDLNLQQFTISDKRRNAVDFSTPYYTTPTAIVSIKGNKGADATTLAGLKDSLLGGAVGTTSLDTAQAEIDPKQKIQNFNSVQDSVAALKAGQVDALAVDLPTALYLAAAELDNGVVVGQLSGTDGGDQFGIVLAKGSDLTAAVSKVVDALQADGTLTELAKKWLTDSAGAPVLK
ncbi:ABC transporter substrate-binding protein [Nocardioides sp.]|uniref:ABC transporter substrate-binding protein n=1 Tax=Nocardioides sp. TaxID=35761 RepID=UPI002628398B|nr:ABC transporter substrate-binding protein [Nocardioides sp.]